MTPRSSKDQFNANADKYAVSDVHRAGPSLPILLALAQPVPSDQSLDVATGPVISALVEHAAQAPPAVRESLGLEFGPNGRVLAFQEPMLVVRLEHTS